MKQNRRGVAACMALLCIFCVGLAYGASNGNKVKVKGLITGRDGENLTLRATDGSATIPRFSNQKGYSGTRRSQ